jgi:hypothetical protein
VELEPTIQLSGRAEIFHALGRAIGHSGRLKSLLSLVIPCITYIAKAADGGRSFTATADPPTEDILSPLPYAGCLQIGQGGMDWIDLAQDRDHWWALVNRAMKLHVS